MALKRKWFRSLFLTAVLFLAVHSFAFGEKVKNDFLAVQVIGNEAWVVGSKGIILNSKDKGENWSIQKSDTCESFSDVCFIDGKHGWAIGAYGMIMHTEDGGQTWKTQDSKVDVMLFDVLFLDTRTGWVCGQEGTVLHTLDGGETWEDLPPVMEFDLYGLHFSDVNHGWVVGEFGVIYKTGDGGRGWIKQKSPIEISYLTGAQQCIFKVVFDKKARHGYAFFMNGGLLFTKDGGDGWDVVPQVTENHFFEGCIYNNRLWIVGQKGSLYTYYDEKIHEIKLSTKRDLVGISFGSDGYGIVVGTGGTLLRTFDSGKTYSLQKQF